MGGGGEKEGAGLGVVLCTWAGLRFPKTCYQDHRKMLPSRCAPVSRHQDQMWASSLHTPSPLYEAPVHTVPTPSPCHKRSLVVKSICDVRLCDPAALSFTISWSLLKLMSIESVMPSKHLILWRPFLLLPSVFPSTRVFSNESLFHIRWPEYWSFSFSISPSNEYSGWIFFRMDFFDLLAVWGTLKSLLQHHSSKAFPCSSVLSLLYGPTLTSIHDSRKNHSFD